MPLVFADRVRQITTTVGVADIVLGSVVSGFQSFSDGVGVGNTTLYCIVDTANADWEVGTGTLSTTADLQRTMVSASSNNNVKVSFKAGTKDVFVTFSGAEINNVESKIADLLSDALRKSANLSGLTDAATARLNLELGTAATANLTTTPTDTTAGRVLKVGDFGVGIGGTAQIVINDVDRIDIPAGFYRVNNVTTGTFPANSGSHYGTLIVEAYNLTSGVESFCQTFTLAFSAPRRWFRYYAFNLLSGSPGWSDWVELLHTGNFNTFFDARLNTQINPWLCQPIGVPFPLIGDATPPPTNDPNYRYVLLSAGQTGPGGYNNGVLGSETVTGTAPLIDAVANVTLPASPLYQKSVHLINTEKRFVGAGTQEGFEEDSIQGHYHHVYASTVGTNTTGNQGRFADSQSYDLTANNRQTVLEAISDGINGTPRVANHTQPRAHRVPHYMRIL